MLVCCDNYVLYITYWLMKVNATVLSIQLNGLKVMIKG